MPPQPMRHLTKQIFTLLRPKTSFHVRRGTAQNQPGAGQPTAFLRQNPGMKARCIILFIAGLMFFINHQQTQIGCRRKNSRTRTDYQIITPLSNAQPGRTPLRPGQPGMKHRHAVAKTLLKNAHRLRRQGNFRHQNNTLLTSTTRFLGQPQINFRLAAAGHPMQ